MKTKPYKHQLEWFERTKDDIAHALLWQMRVGKSKTVIDTAFHLRDRGSIEATLVLAPNGVHSNWVRRELPTHAWDDDWTALTWRSSREGMEGEVARMVKAAAFPVLSVNSESLIVPRVQASIKRLLSRGRVLLIVDESHDFRTPGSRRTKLARGLAARCAYRRILTGTPVLNSPLHAYSQYELLERGALGFGRYGDFKARYSVPELRRTRGGRQYEVIASYQNLEELRERMSRLSSVVLRGDVDDMPEVVPMDRPVPMSTKQAAAYRRLVDEWLLEDEFEVNEGGTRALKLQQILGGWYYDGDGEVVSVDDSPPRLDALVDTVEGMWPEKTIVWCRFREDIRRVVERLRAEGFDPVEYHGGVPSRRRDENEDRFREDPRCNPLVAQPQSGGQGLDLSTAGAIAWYGYSHDAILWEQAQERATKIGGRSVAMFTFFTEGSVELPILEALRGRRSVADMLSGRGLRDLLMTAREGGGSWDTLL